MSNFQTRKERQDFYQSKEWSIIRKFMLSRNPLCEFCIQNDRIKPAEAVDHKRDIIDAPHLRLDPSNLQCLCASCHNKKSAIEASGSEKDLKIVNRKWNVEPLKIPNSKKLPSS